jgi:chromosomal replication initiation ATPase DnaA
MTDKKAHEVSWQECLTIIKDNVTPQSYKTWFEPIKAIRLTNKVLTIQVPSQFFYEWLEEHYVQLLHKTLKKVIGPISSWKPLPRVTTLRLTPLTFQQEAIAQNQCRTN